MAEESPTGGERTEEPTTKRREDFREKGQVAQSKEVQTAFLFTGLLVFWIFYMPIFWHGNVELLRAYLQAIGEYQINQASVLKLAYFTVKHVGILIIPLLMTSAIIGVLSTYFQIGWLFTVKPLQLNFKKFDPIQGSKKFFSKKSLIDVVKSLAKIIFVGYVAYSTIFNNFDEALLLPDQTAGAALLFFAKTAAIIFAKVCAALIFIAFVDYLFVTWELEQKMKMTKQEVKEEGKESEGDPLIRAKIRSIQQEMARKRMMAEVPKADVVITNPTHFAIAVRYDSDEMEAPIITAKGADHLAMAIRKIAKENKIPIVENPPVARLLHKLDLGAQIPEEMFKAVAEILAHVYTLKGTDKL